MVSLGVASVTGHKVGNVTLEYVLNLETLGDVAEPVSGGWGWWRGHGQSASSLLSTHGSTHGSTHEPSHNHYVFTLGSVHHSFLSAHSVKTLQKLLWWAWEPTARACPRGLTERCGLWLAPGGCYHDNFVLK